MAMGERGGPACHGDGCIGCACVDRWPSPVACLPAAPASLRPSLQVYTTYNFVLGLPIIFVGIIDRDVEVSDATPRGLPCTGCLRARRGTKHCLPTLLPCR